MKSVSSRLLLIMLTIVIIGMGLIAILGSVLAGKALNEQSLGRIDEATTTEVERMESWLVRQIGYIDAVATDFSSMSDVSPEALLPALVRHADLNEEYFAVYAGYPDGSAIFNDEWEPGSDWIATERDWYKGAMAAPKNVYITELYADADTGNLCITLSKVFTHNGATAGVVAIDIFINIFHDIVNNIHVGQSSYALLTDQLGNIIVHQKSVYDPVIDANGEVIFQNLAHIENNMYADLRKPEILNGGSIRLQNVDGVLCNYTARIIPSNGWVLYTVVPMKIVNAPIHRQITVSVIVFVVVLCVAVFLIYFSLRKLITHPVKDVTEAGNLLAQGETGARLEGDYVGEIALLAKSFLGMEAFNIQQAEWLEYIANGDLSIEVKPRGEKDRIGHAIGSMLKKLNGMFANFSQSTHQATDSAKQVSDGAQSLAQSSTEQAALIEELSGSFAEIAEETTLNANKARKAAELAEIIRGNAEKGSHQMDELINAVKGINDASHNVIKIIKVIDDIAFQTNILALNAAVEAARAGQHGKGFAVVADEVRSLAAKSAEAAKETGDMIQSSMEKAELGSRIADETAASLNEIVSGINESHQLVAEIASASERQSEEIGQINTGIEQVAQVVQQNSATAEESAAASEEMNSQAELLKGLILQFKLRDNERKRF